MMVIMKASSAVQWNPMVGADREIVARVTLNGLKATQCQIDQQGEKVRTDDHWRQNGSETEKHNFKRMRIFCCNPYRS